MSSRHQPHSTDSDLDLFPAVPGALPLCEQIVYDQEVDTLNQAHEEQREEEKQNSEQKMNEVQVK